MGSFSILNNIAGLNAQNQLNINNVNLTRTMLRLSSGKRINSGADDAAGLQRADSLRANVRALDQAVRNANDAIGVGQIADGALQEITNLLTRAVTLAEEAATDTMDDAGRQSLNQEFTYIEAEIARIAQQTNFNGLQLFTATGLNGTLDVFVGDVSTAASSASTITIKTGTITVGAGGDTVTGLVDPTDPAATVDLTAVNLLQQADAPTALTTIKNALAVVGKMRASIGAGMNRLQSAVAVLQTQSQNTLAAESGFRDANIAEEVANLTRYQILAQSGIATLAQANSNSQIVLALIKNG